MDEHKLPPETFYVKGGSVSLGRLGCLEIKTSLGDNVMIRGDNYHCGIIKAGISGDKRPFRPAIDMMPNFTVYRRNSQYKTPKNGKNKIRPANSIFDGVITPSVKGAVKNLNPRKGTETTYNFS